MSTLMTPSQRFMSIRIRDPVSGLAPSRNVQWRTLQMYRNTGSVLLHHAPHPTQRGRVTSTVLEVYNDLEGYHRPEYVYDLVRRDTYNVASYTAALEVMNDPLEPPFTLKDLQPIQPYKTLLNATERDRLTQEWAEVGPLKQKGPITLRFDCLLSSPTHAAMLTTVDELTEDAVLEFYDRCLYVHFLSTRLACAEMRARWARFFEGKAAGGGCVLYLASRTVPHKDALLFAHDVGVRPMVKDGLGMRVVRRSLDGELA